jgi:hypothetical protein
MATHRQVAAMTSASKIRDAATTLLKSLAVALIAVMPCTPALADALTRISISLRDANNGTNEIVQECTGNVCSLPTTEPLEIPYPIATIDATDGVLRGRMRMEVDFRSGDTTTEAFLESTVSFQVMGSAFIRLGAPAALIELGMTGITGSQGFLNSSVIRAGACGPYSECLDQTVTTNSAYGVLNAAGEVVARNSSGDSVSAGREGGPWDGERPIMETGSLEVPAEERFGLFWEFATLLHLNRQGRRGLHYAENDFSHTLGFTSLRFYDPDGNDVTQWVDVTFDSPLAFISAPVPEPETYALMLSGLAVLGFAARRRKLKEAAAA